MNLKVQTLLEKKTVFHYRSKEDKTKLTSMSFPGYKKITIICYPCLYNFHKEMQYEKYASKNFFPRGTEMLKRA